MYEDVEGVKKLLLEQNLHKRKAGLKSKSAHSVLALLLKPELLRDLVFLAFLPDPYADSQSTVSLI